MRVAAIDIGTNTVLLLIADGGPSGMVRAAAERATITRLGEGVDRTRRLAPAAVARTVQCLEAYAREVHELGAERVAVVGTSAMRDAADGEVLRERVRSLFGVEARVLGGDEEALLTFRGAMSGLPLDGDRHLAIFDIGGGSTEVVIGRMQHGDPRIDFATSYDVGGVRLTERLITHDPPSREETDALVETARSTFACVPPMPNSNHPVGVAGTMTTLAAVFLGLGTYDGERVHGTLMQVTDLRRVVQQLASLKLDARRVVRGMEPMRADVIVAGGLLALALLDHWGAAAVRISDRGVRWGLAEELLLES